MPFHCKVLRLPLSCPVLSVHLLLMTYRATFLSLCLMCAACPCTFLPHPCVRPVRPATCSLLSSRFTLVSCPCRAIVLVIVMAWQFMCHVLLSGLYLDVVLVLSLSCVALALHAPRMSLSLPVICRCACNVRALLPFHPCYVSGPALALSCP